MNNKNIVLSFISLQTKKPNEGNKCLVRAQNFYNSDYEYDVLTWHDKDSLIWAEPKILDDDPTIRLFNAVMSKKYAPEAGFYKIINTDNGLDEVLVSSKFDELEWTKLN